MAISDSVTTKPSANGSQLRSFKSLSPKHVDDLARSGITKEQALAAGVYTETDSAKISRILNWDSSAACLGPCMVFTYHDMHGNPIDVFEYATVKPDTPLTRKDKKKPSKYESPARKAKRVYFVPSNTAALADVAIPIIFVEGEKKALKATLEGRLCIGLVGVNGWSKPREKDAEGKDIIDPVTGKLSERSLSEQLERLPWQDRSSLVIFDSDIDENKDVQRESKVLATALLGKNAIPKIVHLEPLPNGEKCGLDDFLVAHSAHDLQALIDRAAPFQLRKKKAKPKEPSQAAILMQIGEEAELSHCPDGIAYATIGRKTLPVTSDQFEMWIRLKYDQSRSAPPPQDALTQVLKQLQAKAIHGVERAVNLRVAGNSERIELFLANADKDIIEIDRNGWRLCKHPTHLFRQPRGMRPMPLPIPGGDLDSLLRPFLNLASDLEWTLLKAWLVTTLRPQGPFPLLSLQGEQASAKSTTAKLLKNLTDPNAADLRSPSRDERDLAVAAKNSWVLCYDNLSKMPGWLSDAFCRLTHHGGFAVRKNYADDEEQIFSGSRPIITTGIEDVAQRGDLISRSLPIRLTPPKGGLFFDEAKYWYDFHQMHPKILGALLDLVSGAMRELPSVQIQCKHRMADFVLWAVAAERGAGGDGEKFLKAYAENQSEANEIILEDDIVAKVLRKWCAESPGPSTEEETGDDLPGWENGQWDGTATQLKAILDARIGETIKKKKASKWPADASALSNKLRRLASSLREVGIVIENQRSPGGNRKRTIFIKMQNAVPARPARPETSENRDSSGTGRDGEDNVRDARDDEGVFVDLQENPGLGTGGTRRDGDLHRSKM